MKSVRGCGHADGAAGEDQVVIGIDAVLVTADDGERTGPVEGQVVPGEDRSAGAFCQRRLTELRAAGQEVFAAFCQGQEDLVRLFYPDAGVVGAGDVHTVQFDPDLRRVIGVHADVPVAERPGDFIITGVGDDHRAPVGIGAFAGNRGAFTVERDDCRVFALPLTVLIIGGEVGQV